MDIDLLRTQFQLNQLAEDTTPKVNGNLRQAAVLVAIEQIENQPQIILTRRPHHLRAHPGQISFPGGKVEHTDKDYTDTALREAEEEIGLHRHNVEVIGQYPSFKTFTGFEITPVMGIVKQPFTPNIDPGEVAALFSMPLSFALEPKNRHVRYFQRGDIHYPVYFIQYQQHFIWGATAAIIDRFCRQFAL
ncbi:CoA pyrophosphatase [Shewanella sp. Scap07]|uniref:CoA pyrophosphatase n=1 Tax=Shewanella sp. Scap07 TaxID=2589987 RepID=UPI0015BFAAB6|nr:CoA pyrophosphatase [Shewanella sp. Scap07]QLE85479.1 CoA pyrophosphatase [Shewanella sp. Scap07]